MSADTPRTLEVPELVAVRLDNVVLALSMRELHSLEPVIDVVAENTEESRVGYITVGELRLPVYSLDDALRPRPNPPIEQRVCALLGEGQPKMGLICDSVRSLVASDYDTSPMPKCMVADSSPIQGLVMYDGTVLCWTELNYLQKYLNPNANDGVEGLAV